MKTSHKFGTGMTLFGLLISGCSAKVDVPKVNVPLQGGGTGNQFQATPTPSDNSTTFKNAILGKKYSGMMGSIEVDSVNGNLVKVDRKCEFSDDFCTSFGQTAQETFTVEVNQPNSIFTASLSNGKKAQTSLAGDEHTLTLTTKVFNADGSESSDSIHVLTVSGTPCGDSTGAGIEDNLTSRSYFSGGYSDTKSCLPFH